MGLAWFTAALTVWTVTAAVVEPAGIESAGVVLAGEWMLPTGEKSGPCVVIAGGTMSHTRDGAMVGGGPAGDQRDALKRLAVHLAANGYASLRWDKRGRGETPAGPQPVTDAMEAEDVAAAIRAARAHPRVSQVIVAGESAGAYFACLAAKGGVEADGYILLGALASSVEELFRFNYGRLHEWASASDVNRAWAETHAAWGMGCGANLDAIFAAARRGESECRYTHNGRPCTQPLGRMRAQMQDPPASLFKHLQKPVLVLQGEADMNVPPGDADTIAALLREAGNGDVSKVGIPGADHSFQVVSADPDDRMRERHGFASFYRLYSPRLYAEITSWLQKRFPTEAETGVGPELPRPGIIAWPGIQVIEDITDPRRSPGVPTLEGRIGPLLKAGGGQAHFIEMPAGMYCGAHGHSTESIIYTVRGRWVLASGGRRQLMEPGALLSFGAGVPTGYEVPFDEPAYILIFKTERSDWSDERFWEYLQGMAARLEQENADGTPYRLSELPPDHPARVFARQVNPQGEHPADSGAAPTPTE